MGKILKLLALILGLTFPFSVVNAGQPAEQEAEQPAIYEMSILPKKTPEELEQERWAYLMSNGTGLFLYDNKALAISDDNKDVVQILVLTIYRDKQIIDKLNNKYGSKLEDDDSAINSDMQMLINVRKKTYAIIDSKLFSKQGKLLYENIQDKKFFPIKSQTLMDTVYMIAKNYQRNN